MYFPLLQTTPLPPGREGNVNPGSLSATQAADSVPSPAPIAGGGSANAGFANIVMLLLPILLLGFMFWTTRSQQKKQKQMESALKTGDRVVTQSGILGRIDEVTERTFKLEVAPGVKIQVLRSAVAGLDANDVSVASKSIAGSPEKIQEKKAS